MKILKVFAPALLLAACAALYAAAEEYRVDGSSSSCTHAERRSMLKRSCLVSGISGMIGSYIGRELLRRGCHVHGIVRFRTHWGNMHGLLGHSNVTLHTGDITDENFIHSLVDKVRPDYVFHMAAQSLNGASVAVPKLTFDVNIQGTLYLLEALRRSNLTSITKFFNAGSSTVYGKTADTWDGPIPETAPLQPVTPYGVSKVAQEMLGLQYWHSHGLHVVTGRFFQQVAPGGPESLAIQDFAKQIAMCELGITKEKVLYHGNLLTKRDMTDVSDSSRVMVDLIEVAAAGSVYNVCSNRAVPVMDMLRILLSFSPIGDSIILQPHPDRFRSFDEKILLGDNSKLVETTGWKPSTAFNDTVLSVLEYWRREMRARHQVS